MDQKFIWCGSSWEIGEELELILPKSQISKHTYPQLVSDRFGAECLNVSGTHSSIEELVYQIKSVEKKISPGDVVFFSLTPPHWSMFFDSNGDPQKLGPNFNEGRLLHGFSEYWYKFFDSPHQQSWQNDLCIEFLAQWCEIRGVKSFFYSQINHYYPKYITQNINWLLPPTRCLVEILLPVIDNEYFEVVTTDREWLKNDQWQAQKSLVEKYISPCYCHPNLAGHEKISEELVDILQSNHQM